MALRQVIPEFEASLNGHVGQLKVVPRLLQPEVVEFRAKADLSAVVAAIATNRRVQVVAATAAGKSTVLPGKVAEALGLLVVQVFPNSFLAFDVQAYIATLGVKSKYIDGAAVEYPEEGVVCMSAATLAAKWLSAGEVSMPECVVFHDESHESDAYTGLVKRLASTCSEVRSYVSMTATAGPAGFRQAETEGHLIKHTYPAHMTSDTWDLYGDMPWSIPLIQGHMLIYEDSKDKAMRLVRDYQEAGFRAYRLHSRMRMEEFRAAMDSMRSGQGIVIAIADAAFRSGLTVPVARVIDSATVTNVVVENGVPMRVTRGAYEVEKYQAAGRGARLPGLLTEYYCPDRPPIRKICELEAVEVEALALMLRVLGYQVPREFGDAVMAVGGVPRDLSSALKGSTPLALLGESQKVSLEEFSTPAGRRSPFLREDVVFNSEPMDFRDSGIMAETARKHGASSINVSVPRAPEVYKAGRQVVDSRRDSMHDRLNECADVIRSIAVYEDPVDELELGKYYYVVGGTTSEVSSSVFPDGVDSVCKWLTLDKTESAHLGLSPYNRGVAASALASRFNTRTCELRALTSVISVARVRGTGKDHASLAQWARNVSGRVTQLVAELTVVSGYLVRVSSGFCSLVEMPPLTEEETRFSDYVMQGLVALPDAQVGPASSDYDAVRKYIDCAAGTGHMSSIGEMSAIESVQMPVTGRGMRASNHYVAPGGIVGWATGQVPMKRGKLLRVDSRGAKAYVRSLSNEGG